MKKDKDTDLLMREWWVEEIQSITRRVMAEEEKRQARERRKSEKLMGEYEGWTYSDLQEAYGCGLITENKFSKLVRLLEGTAPQPNALYTAKLELLQELYSEQKKILDDRLRWETAHSKEDA